MSIGRSVLNAALSSSSIAESVCPGRSGKRTQIEGSSVSR